MKKEVEVVLFGLEHEGDLRREYKELAEIEEFKDLKVKEVRFCWLVGNRTSPIFKMEREKKIRRALEIVYGKNYSKRPDLKELSSGDIPDHILTGIKKMNSFNPEFRLKAKLMAEYIFETLNELIILDSSEMATMDIDDKKKYADLVVKVSGELQSMVDRLENSYGAVTVSRKEKEKVKVSISDIMQ